MTEISMQGRNFWRVRYNFGMPFYRNSFLLIMTSTVVKGLNLGYERSMLQDGMRRNEMKDCVWRAAISIYS